MSMTGTSRIAKISKVRMFLRADSAEELVRLQLQNSLSLGAEVGYTDITYADGKWYAWFLVDVDQHREFLSQVGLDDGTT